MKKKRCLEGKLIDLLQTLSSKESRRFREYVASPFFNKNNRIVRLLAAVQKHHPDYAGIKREQIFEEVFIDKENYQYNLLRAVVSQLTKLLEKFLAYMQYEEEGNLEEEQLLFALMKRKQGRYYKMLYSRICERLEQAAFKDADFLNNKLEISIIHNKFVTTNESQRSYNETFQVLLHDLDRQYLANKLKYISIAKIWKRIVNGEFEIWMEKEVLDFIDKQDFSDDPAIFIYQKMIKMLDNLSKDEFFFQFKKILLENLDYFKLTEQRQLVTSLINCATWKTNDAPDIFWMEKFKLYKLMIDRKILYSDELPISPHHFRNIVKSAVEVRELDWCETFLGKNKHKLKHRYGQSIVLYSQAEIKFAKGETNNAASIVSKISSEFEQIDFYYQLYYRTLVVKIAYTLVDSVWLTSVLEAFRLYLLRNKNIPTQLKEAYGNLIKSVGRINAKLEPDFSILEYIRELDPLVERKWLLGLVEVR